MTAHQGLLKQVLNLAACVSGIILCYSSSSYFQEKITQGKYAPGDKFTFTQTLVFVQCLVNTVVAFIGRSVDSKALDTVPTSMYAFSAGSYLLAMIFSNQALRYISYPTQVLGKSCKPIPIMLFGVLFAHKSYSARKYMTVLAIVAGVAVFLYKDEKAVSHGHVFEIGYGELLLLASLAMDGTTGAIQDRIRRNHQTNKWSMMLNMNMFSLLFAVFPVSQEYNAFLNFVSRYPNVPLQILILSFCACIGQCFIFKTVTDFGPLTCSIITTTRKLITIIASVILFNHPMSQRQIMGTAIVFLALLVDAIEGKKSHSAKVAAEKEKLVKSTTEKEDEKDSELITEAAKPSPAASRRLRARRAD
uniref:UAA transporter n=1 Tax=Steinernema glaseri TaxID=37863 RepID=A0A1I7YLG5_9BILA